jgi:error-prone DNA polymerase
MGFYAPAQLVRNAREHGVEVREVDVNYSDWDCTLEAVVGGRGSVVSSRLSVANDVALRLGFRMLHGFSERHAERIVAAREGGMFQSMDDLSRRTRLTRSVLSRLSQAGAFGSLAMDHRESLWKSLAQDSTPLPLLDSLEEEREAPVGLPAMSSAEKVLEDYRGVGLSLRAHPMSFFRERLAERGVIPAAELKTTPNGRPVQVAGIVLVRQRPGTAKGITFVTLEDESGSANLIVRPDVWKRFRTAARGATVLLAYGRLQRQEGVIHVLTSRLENLSEWMESLGPQSRDFC